MTSGRVSDGPSRGADAPTRTSRTRDGIGAIVAILALGLVFRLIIARLNPGSGFKVDLIDFQFWANELATHGLYGFYTRPFLHDYTPGYLYVLWLLGTIGKAFSPTTGLGDLIKIPPILADLGLGWLVWSMASELGAGRRAALIGAALVVANPVSWFDSVVWGQVDSFGVVFLLLGLRALWRDQPERAALFTVIAALVKPQLAILIPIVAVVTIRRALWPTRSIPEGDREAPARSGLFASVAAWERQTGRPLRILTTGAVGFLTAVVLCMPFGLSVIDPPKTAGSLFSSGLVEQVFKTAGGYPYVSVNAYNPWALASVDGTGIAENGGWACDTFIRNAVAPAVSCPSAVTIAGVPAVYVGAALLAAAFVIVCLAVARRPTPLTILVGLTLLAIAFFVLPTRVHERYLYPFIALGAILAAASIRWRIAYVVLSATTFLNMYVVLTTIYTDNPHISDWLAIGPAIRSTLGVTSIALTGLAAAVWSFGQMRPAALRRLAAEVDESAALDDDDWASDENVGEIGTEAPPWGVAASMGGAWSRSAPGSPTVAAATRVAAVGVPTWSEPPSFAELGPVQWFRAKVGERPIRADRSRALHGEPGGRLDRLDLWVLAVLVAAILGVRMFRLSEPYQMHFDEVYHARTATEFLQDWRYGIDHDIYEWTHPHLAKYAMAGGLVAWGDDRVTATSDLGVPVVDAVIEPRTDNPALSGDRAGDRVDVVTGSELRSLDLRTRALVARIPVDGASAVAYDASGSQLFVGSRDGTISTVDVAALDALHNAGSATAPPEATAFAQVDGSIGRLLASPDGSSVVALTTDDRAITVDATTAEVLGTVQLEAAGDLVAAGTSPAVVATAEGVADPAEAAKAMASILGGQASTYLDRLRAGAERTVVARIGSSEQRTQVQAAIDDGQLAGLTVDDLPQIAVADANGLELIDPASGSLTRTLSLGAPAHGLALTNVDSEKLYVAIDPDPNTAGQRGRIAIVGVGGDIAKDGPVLIETMPMPGPVTRVAYDDQTEMIHVLGRTPDGSASTVYVIEPHARAVYADARLSFEPAAWVMDAAHDYPTDDRQQVLAFSPAGSVAAIDAGQHEFAWRLPGVLAGTAMAALLYVLARILFRRRSIALLVAVLSLADGMFFVQSRIGMNDAYVGVAIVAAYTIFAALWMGAWRHRGAFWIGMPLVGVCLGLGLASKWVALYALGGIAVLILARSALGRFIAIATMIVLTAVLGYLAINVPADTGFGNLPFVAIMVGLTIAAVVANVAHPVAWSLDEIRFAIGAPVALGGIVALAAIATGTAATPLTVASIRATPVEIALGIAAIGLVAWGLMVLASRLGFGPLAPPPAADDLAALLPPPAPPPAAAWLRPGAQLGLPVAWMVASLFLLPVAIYVASYIPWAFLDSHRLFGTWPNGHTGQSLTDLTGAMYAYHNGLPTPHAASSPWWAWLFDFKPVWFYQEGLAGNTTAAIYDAGNLVAWWLGLPALAFVAWQAYARRSLPLALIAIGFACQWVSWARIERAAFQYHYYTSLPFLFLGLAYFLAELWHGASRRTWLLARLSAGAAVLGPAFLWIFDRPFCAFVGVARANPSSAGQACQPTIPQFLLTTQTLALAVVVGISVLVVLRQFGKLAGNGLLEEGDSPADGSALLPLVVTAIAASALTVAIRLFVPDTPLLVWNSIPVEPVAVVLALPAVGIAAFVATARDARRFVIGAVVAVVAWFVVVYPNISALPLPTAIANVYQGVLPTYLYAFQFPVNNVAATVPIQLLGPVPLLLGGAMAFLSLVVAYSAWVWRLALAERTAAESDRLELGTGSGGAAIGD